MILDTELLDRASTALGTNTKTETVRTALEDAVRRSHIESLVGWEIPDGAWEDLGESRRWREFDEAS